jgi:hypothetical protein
MAAAISHDPEVEALWLDPEPARPGKERWQQETFEARVEMCELMGAECSSGVAGIGTLRKDLGPEVGTSPELFRVLRALLGGPGQGKLIWALGADVFDGMQHWAAKARACFHPGETCDGLFLFSRGDWTEERLWRAWDTVRDASCEIRIVPMPSELLGISSHFARQALVVADTDRNSSHEIQRTMTPNVAKFCLSRPDVRRIYTEQVAFTSVEKSLHPISSTSGDLKRMECSAKHICLAESLQEDCSADTMKNILAKL